MLSEASQLPLMGSGCDRLGKEGRGKRFRAFVALFFPLGLIATCTSHSGWKVTLPLGLLQAMERGLSSDTWAAIASVEPGGP